MQASRLRKLLIVAVLISAAPALARVNNPNVALNFSPQDAVGAASAAIPSHVRTQPVAISVVEGRPGSDAAVIGSRTNDDDQLIELRATGEVRPFVEDVARRLARAWGLKVDPEADLSLVVELLTFDVVESNQAVGATYSATVRIEGALKRGGSELWSGSASGDATRYGKKFSNENCNEVLSDSLKEAFAELYSLSSLHRAWKGGQTGVAPAAPAAPPAPAPTPAPIPAPMTGVESISPPALLEELKKLLAQDFSEATLAQYVGGKTLSAPLSAEDLAHWKAAGVPEQVMRTAMSRPVR